MHQVVAIPELFSLIAKECTDSRSSLSSLARTCRRFCEPSLDALYGSATVDLRHLAILPLEHGHEPEEREERDLMEERNFLRFDGEALPLSAATWRRFDYYAVKVKHLKFSFDDFGEDVLVTLNAKAQVHSCRVANRPVLFPKLYSLALDLCCYDIPNHSSSSILLPFLTPTLADLSLNFTFLDSELHTLPGLSLLRPILRDLIPNIQSVTFDIPTCEGPLAGEGDRFFQAIAPQGHSLRVIDVSTSEIDNTTMKQILSGPHLEILKIDAFVTGWPVLLGPDRSWLVPDADGPFRSSLTCLSLDTHLSAIESIFESLDLPLLTDLSLSVDLSDSPYKRYFAEELLELLLKRTTCSSMKKISIAFRSDNPVHFLNICPLFAFEDLQELVLKHIELGAGFSFTDKNIRRLAMAFKKLQKLILKNVFKLTLESFISLSITCPHLAELDISVDATIVPVVPSSRFQPSSANSVLKKLTFRDSPVHNPISVGTFLHQIFPALEEVDAIFEKPIEDEYGERWLWSQVPKFMTD